MSYYKDKTPIIAILSVLIGVIGFLVFIHSLYVADSNLEAQQLDLREKTNREKIPELNICLEKHTDLECEKLFFPEEITKREIFRECISQRSEPSESYASRCSKAARID